MLFFFKCSILKKIMNICHYFSSRACLKIKFRFSSIENCSVTTVLITRIHIFKTINKYYTIAIFRQNY